MPVQVYEDSQELTIDVLEKDGYTKASWPHQCIKAREPKEHRSYKTVVIENEYLKLIVLPELGGRLWDVIERRRPSAVFGGGNEVFIPACGETDVEIRRGLTVSAHGTQTPASLKQAEIMMVEPDTALDSGSILVHQIGPSDVITRFSLAPGDARVRIEVTVHNRERKPMPYQPNTVWIENEHYNVYNPDSIFAGTFCLNFEPGTFEKPDAGVWEEDLQLQRRRPGAMLGPGQSDSYSFYLTPVSGINTVCSCNEYGVGQLYVPRKPVDENSKEPPDRPQFFFRASRLILGAKLLIQNDSGATFEMPVDLYPEKVHYSDLTSIPWKVVAAELRDSSGKSIATVLPPTNYSEQTSEPLPTPTPTPTANVRELSDAQLLNLTSDFTLRVPAYLELAARATERGDYQRADTCYEHALLFNGDDPLAWWAKSVNRRIGNLDDENAERTELLNAHYLSPLEPCLRAEAFLAQPRNHGKDPSPLLASFNDVPENFVEVACQLIQARFYEEAAYFIDEALRHQNLGMLHYLHAHLLSRKGGMEMEVASRIQMASKAQFPPMPYRDLEREILMKLVEIHKLPQPIMDWLSDNLD